MTRRALLTFCLSIVVLTGCSSDITYDPVRAHVPGMSAKAADEIHTSGVDSRYPTGKVTVWSYYAGAEWIIPIIQEQYPDLTIEITAKSWDKYAENYLAAIDAGNAPDVLFVDNNMLSKLVGMNIFEDLSTYGGEDLAELFSSTAVAPYRSLEDNRLFGLPLDIGPAVAYYRHDLFLKAGLPAEPEELSRFMENPDNWLTAANKLKQQGSWIAFSKWDPVWMSEYTASFFDRSLDYARDTSSFAAAIDLARTIDKNRLASDLDQYSYDGRAAINDGRTAMFYNGWWYRNDLKTYAPDTFGKWRMMRLPLGMYGSAGSSGTIMSASSGNKAGAWAVISALAKHSAETVGNSESILDKPDADVGDPFFGGQQTQILYAELVQNMPLLTPTPLDERANRIWSHFIYSALDNDRDPNELLQNIRQLTTDSLQSELDLLKAERTP